MPTFTVSAAESGRTVLDVLRSRLGKSPGQTRRLIAQQRVRLGGALCRDTAWLVRRGQRLEVHEPKQAATIAIANGNPQIRYVDEHIVVVEKPPGLTTMRHPQEAAEFGSRGRRFLPPTLARLLPGLLARRCGRPGRLWAVHRLDRDTSGLVIFARTRIAEGHLGKQFRAHTIKRSYLAIVRGHAQPARLETYLVDDRGDGRRGSSPHAEAGKRAVTHVAVIEQLGEYSLVECRLETGRTHQVRIHLGEAGTPICGERIYDRPIHGKPVPDNGATTRLALHAATLGVEHPGTGKWQEWHAPLPKDLQALLERLRTQA